MFLMSLRENITLIHGNWLYTGKVLIVSGHDEEDGVGFLLAEGFVNGSKINKFEETLKVTIPESNILGVQRDVNAKDVEEPDGDPE